jgi:hypothetical protein
MSTNEADKNVVDMLKNLAEEYKTDPESFSNKKNKEIDPIIDKLVEIEKRHKYKLDKSNTRSRRIDLREELDKHYKQLTEKKEV